MEYEVETPTPTHTAHTSMEFDDADNHQRYRITRKCALHFMKYGNDITANNEYCKHADCEHAVYEVNRSSLRKCVLGMETISVMILLLKEEQFYS